MVAPRRRPAHLGAPHAPQTAASWTRAPGPGGPHWSAPGPARGGRPQPVARVAARCPWVWCRRGRGARGSVRPPRPHPTVRTGDRERTHLRRAPGAAGRVRERRRSRANEWSQRLLAGDLRPVPGRTARRCQGGCGRLPLAADARLLVAGRPRPTVPSDDVTH
nr:translation initiation factor IF-2-like [Pongo abelii]